MGDVRWEPLKSSKHEYRKRKTSDGPNQHELKAKEGLLQRGETLEDLELSSVGDESGLEDIGVELLQSGTPTSRSSTPVSSVKRRSSFSLEISTQRDELMFPSRQDSAPSLSSISIGSETNLNAPESSRINIGGGFNIDEASGSSALSPISPRYYRNSKSKSSFRARFGKICFGLFCTMFIIVIMLSFSGTHDGKREEDSQQHQDKDSIEQGKAPAPTVPHGGAPGENDHGEFPIGIAILIVTLALLFLAFVGIKIRQRHRSDTVLMLRADDELNSVVEKARAQWRAGLSHVNGSSSPHLEPTNSQRQWAAESIATLEAIEIM